jgi:hypothetical protein
MSDTVDPFAAYAEQHMRKGKPRAVRVVTSEADAPMKPSPMEQKQRDQSTQLGHFKRAKKLEHQAILDSDHAAPYARMLAILKRLPDRARELVEHLGKGWIKCLSAQQKQTVLSMISARIIRVREIDGRAPFDDPMPGEPDNLFLICRKIITGV